MPETPDLIAALDDTSLRTPDGWTITPPEHAPADTTTALLQAAAEALRYTSHIGRPSRTAGDLYGRIGALNDLARKLEQVTRKLADDANALADRPGVEPAGACLDTAERLLEAASAADDMQSRVNDAHTRSSAIGQYAAAPQVDVNLELRGYTPTDPYPPQASRWWVSWYGAGGFEYDGPWWITGYEAGGDQRATLAAAVEAPDAAAAQQVIADAHDEASPELDWRFALPRPDDWAPFTDRFPRADWMRWPR